MVKFGFGGKNILGFIIWDLVGILIIALGIKDLFSKKPVRFWANINPIKVNDVKGSFILSQIMLAFMKDMDGSSFAWHRGTETMSFR